MARTDPDLERVTRRVLTVILALGSLAWAVARAMAAGVPDIAAQLPPWYLSVAIGVAMWLAWARVRLAAGERRVAAMAFTAFTFIAPVVDGTGGTLVLPQIAIVTVMLVFGPGGPRSRSGPSCSPLASP